MASGIDREALAMSLARMDPQQHKIVGGLLVVLFRHPTKIRDREWLLEQLTEVVVLAGDFENPETVQDYLKTEVDGLLNCALRIFGCVGEDLTPRAAEGLTLEAAMLQALTYLGQSEAAPNGPKG
jgi:hypothetical protein